MTTDNDQRDSDWVSRVKYETASKAAMKAMESSAAWKKAHENLLAVRQQDITALTNRAEKAEAERDALREDAARSFDCMPPCVYSGQQVAVIIRALKEKP